MEGKMQGNGGGKSRLNPNAKEFIPRYDVFGAFVPKYIYVWSWFYGCFVKCEYCCSFD